MRDPQGGRVLARGANAIDGAGVGVDVQRDTIANVEDACPRIVSRPVVVTPEDQYGSD